MSDPRPLCSLRLAAESSIPLHLAAVIALGDIEGRYTSSIELARVAAEAREATKQ